MLENLKVSGDISKKSKVVETILTIFNALTKKGIVTIVRLKFCSNKNIAISIVIWWNIMLFKNCYDFVVIIGAFQLIFTKLNYLK